MFLISDWSVKCKSLIHDYHRYPCYQCSQLVEFVISKEKEHRASEPFEKDWGEKTVHTNTWIYIDSMANLGI